MPEQFVTVMPRGRQTLPDARGPLQNGVRCHRPRGDGSNSQGNHAVLHGAELEHGSERDVQFGPRCRLRPRSLTRTIRRRIRRARIGITGLWVMADGIFLLGDDITTWGSAVNRDPQLNTSRAVDLDYVYAIFPGQPVSRNGFVCIVGNTALSRNLDRLLKP